MILKRKDLVRRKTVFGFFKGLKSVRLSGYLCTHRVSYSSYSDNHRVRKLCRLLFFVDCIVLNIQAKLNDRTIERIFQLHSTTILC